jgi:hypothetical protein
MLPIRHVPDRHEQPIGPDRCRSVVVVRELSGTNVLENATKDAASRRIRVGMKRAVVPRRTVAAITSGPARAFERLSPESIFRDGLIGDISGLARSERRFIVHERRDDQ